MTAGEHIYAKEIKYFDDHEALLKNPAEVARIADEIRGGDVYIARKIIDSDTVSRLKEYLRGIGRSSLPNYKPIEVGCPNFHRMNKWDERAYVQGCFHQFVFFPWNQDLFDLFSLARTGYLLKNAINGIPADKFMGREPEDGCIARLAFQFYPAGQGALNKHVDPVDHHQMTVPIMILSKKGTDFKTGGAFVDREDGERIYLDEICDEGDVVYFNANMPHGVDTIDEGSEVPWADFQGRWMLLFATNKLSGETSIADAQEVK